MGSIEYPFPVAVKTGTSSRFRDAWAVACSSRYLVGAWVGDPDFRPMRRLTGSSSAAELVKRVLTRWRLKPGAHVIQARLPNTPTTSSTVRVFVD
jgi:penicillin-binding protein 1C